MQLQKEIRDKQMSFHVHLDDAEMTVTGKLSYVEAAATWKAWSPTNFHYV